MSPSVSHDAVGLVVADRYRLVAQVGKGPTATVYLADDVRLRRRVAVKLLDAGLGSEEGFLSRFRSELQAAAQLRHPHIGAVHDWGVDRVPFVVSDYFDHGSLRRLIDRGVVLEPSQVMQVALAGARALAYAHERGVVQRAVRPENLLFTVDGRVEIVDFGLARARAEGASTRPLDLSGSSLGYVAPEQAHGGAIDDRADVYALVVVLVEAATGRPPLGGTDRLSAEVRPLPIPSQVGPMREVLARASMVDPEDRLDAAGLVTALMAVADGYPDPDPIPLQRASFTADPDPIAGDDITIVGIPGMSLPDIPQDAGLPEQSVVEQSTTVEVAPVVPPDLTREPASVPEVIAVREESAGFDDGAEPTPGEDGTDPPDDTDEHRRGRAGRRIVWIVLAVLIVVGGGVVSYFVVQTQRTPTHLVPDVKGLTPDEAGDQLTTLGFDVKTRHIRRDGTSADELVGVEPGSGTRVAEGKPVTLIISDGPPLVAIPDDLEGLSAKDATARLEKLGLGVDRTDERYSEDIGEGGVIGTEPTTGQQLEKGSVLELIVSKGPEPRVIPSISGMSPDQLDTTLRDMGLVPSVTERYDTEIDKGGLIGVDPSVGVTVPRGATVEVIVSKGLLVAVPGLDGIDTVAGAIQQLEESGLVADELLGSGSLSGRPAAFDPPAGQLVAKGSKVGIVVR